MRAVVLGALFVPFAVYAWRDHRMHSRARAVPRLEALLHLGLGVALAGMLATALMARLDRMLVFLAMFAALGALDELVYHRAQVPAEEHSIHAKQHLVLLVFVSAALAWDRVPWERLAP